jgi:tetrahydromethanopterin S-methyltransferase subunit G
MAVMARDTWTDARLDDLNAKVDRGFEGVDKRLDRIENRLDSAHRTQIAVLITICGCMFTGFASLAALIVAG